LNAIGGCGAAIIEMKVIFIVGIKLQIFVLVVQRGCFIFED